MFLSGTGRAAPLSTVLHLEVIRVLVKEFGADVDSKDAMGFSTPLHLAVENGRLEVLRVLAILKQLNCSKVLSSSHAPNSRTLTHIKIQFDLKHFLPLTKLLAFRDICICATGSDYRSLWLNTFYALA